MERLGVGVGEKKLGVRKKAKDKQKKKQSKQQQQQANTFSKGMFFVRNPQFTPNVYSLNDC